MKSKIVAFMGAAALTAAIFAGPASAAPTGGNSCVGAAVSGLAHLAQQSFDQGLGTVAKSLGINIGHAVQEYDAANCDTTG
jgi:hypothetical protein